MNDCNKIVCFIRVSGELGSSARCYRLLSRERLERENPRHEPHVSQEICFLTSIELTCIVIIEGLRG